MAGYFINSISVFILRVVRPDAVFERLRIQTSNVILSLIEAVVFNFQGVYAGQEAAAILI